VTCHTKSILDLKIDAQFFLSNNDEILDLLCVRMEANDKNIF